MSFELAALTSDKEVNAVMQADMHMRMHNAETTGGALTGHHYHIMWDSPGESQIQFSEED